MRESEEERSLFDEFLRKWGEVEEREVALEEEKRGGSIEIERVACFCGRRGWRTLGKQADFVWSFTWKW